MGTDCEQPQIFRAVAQLLSAAIREFFAVGLFLALSTRAHGYDFFNTGMILFLILVVVRLPFINSYAFIFEATTIRSWDIKHVGIQKQKRSGYNFIHAIAILASHICAGIAAAGFRIYFEVAFGTETMGAQPRLTPQLVVDTRVLERMGTAWFANERLGRLGQSEGVRTFSVPLNSTENHGIDKTALLLWYFAEDTAYVLLLCICFVHIWIGTGVVKEKDDGMAGIPLNPFRPRYWKQLFQISILLTMVQLALSRAFPTAHGSLHVTVYKLQYQAWRPGAHEVDHENNEAAVRILGGLTGVALAKIYSWALLSTKQNKDDVWYFSLVWGMESPFAAEEAAAARSVPSGCEETADIESASFAASCLQARGKMDGSFVRKPDFKLRLPYTLNHSK